MEEKEDDVDDGDDDKEKEAARKLYIYTTTTLETLPRHSISFLPFFQRKSVCQVGIK